MPRTRKPSPVSQAPYVRPLPVSSSQPSARVVGYRMNVRPYPMTDVQTKLWQPMFAFEPHVKEILAKAFEAPCTKATRKLGRAFFDFLQFKAAVSQIGTVKERESKHELARVPYKASLVFFPWQSLELFGRDLFDSLAECLSLCRQHFCGGDSCEADRQVEQIQQETDPKTRIQMLRHWFADSASQE